MKFIRLGKELWDMSKIPPGLALFTLDDETQKNYIDTLEKVAEIGYKLIEPIDRDGIQAEGMPADEFVKVLKRLGLGVVSVRILPDHPETWQTQLDFAKKIGAKYFYTLFRGETLFQDEAGLQEAIRILRALGTEGKRRGLQMLFHPYVTSFSTLGGKLILDRLLEGVGTDLMKLELDTYWALKGGADPLQTLLKYKGIVPLVHVKDMDKAGDFTELGRGVIDFPAIFRVFKDVGVEYYFVEQDVSKDPLNSIQVSLDYLRSIGVA